MSNKQILDYFETDKKKFEERGVQGQMCVQTAGDLMIIPESWGHGVLNIQVSKDRKIASNTAYFAYADFFLN